MAWIETIDVEHATGTLREVYKDVIRKRGKLSNIMRVHSLHPDAMQKHTGLYYSILFDQSSLSREEREILAVTVSVMNQCPYCIFHHSEALRCFCNDDSRIDRFIQDPTSLSLPKKKQIMI